MRVAILATAGKDSTLALYRVLNEGHDVRFLVSMIPLRRDSWMFHYPNIHLVDHFAKAVGIPLVKAETSGVKEKEVEDLKSLVAELDVEGIVSGAIASSYQKTRIERVCRQLGLKSITPLWHNEETGILREIISLKFKAIITGVFAHGFNQEWLAREINNETVEALVKLNREYGISVMGEGGEYETLVLDAPLFRKKIRIVEAEVIWEGESGYLLVKNARLEDK